MNDSKLVIPPKEYTGESAVISMRLPKDMLEKIDSLAQSTGRTRNEIMSICIEFALKHYDVDESNKAV